MRDVQLSVFIDRVAFWSFYIMCTRNMVDLCLGKNGY